MNSFWPEGIQLQDTHSPKQILLEAQRDWEQSTGGLMTLVFMEAANRGEYALMSVVAKHTPTNRTTTLFDVISRPTIPYPAKIQITGGEELPELLQKTTWQSLGANVTALASGGRYFTNVWVTDTPTEFRQKLKDAFNLGVVKGKILNLACGPDEQTTGVTPPPEN